MSKRVVLMTLAAVSLLAMAVPGQVAQAAPAPANDYCVVHVTGQKASGELTTSSPKCYATLATSMQAEHVGAYGPNAQAKAAAAGLSSFTLGLHCDRDSLGTPCTSVVGTSCSGGWLNTSAAWSNKINSTQHGCPTIIHYESPNLVGGSATTLAPGIHNLGAFANHTESIQYF